MNLIRLAIERPIAVIAVVLMVVMFGLVALQTIPIQLSPDVNRPVITVTTSWPGAAPAEVEREILNRQEEEMAGLEGLQSITGRAQPGRSRLTLEFNVGTNMDRALLLVSNRLDRVSGYPDEASEPTLDTAGSEDQAIAWFVVTRAEGNERPIHEFGDFMEDVIKDRIERVPGVSRVNVYGGSEREIQITTEPRLLARYGLTVSAVTRALRQGNASMTAGDVDEGKRRYVTRIEGELNTLDTIREVVLRSHEDPRSGRLARVTLGDVATVEFGHKKPGSNIRMLGQSAMAFNALRETGANVIEIMSGISEAVDELNAAAVPNAGLKLQQVYKETVYINAAIDLVRQNIWIGGTLAIVILLLFLRSLRATFIISIAIPVSVIGAFVAMAALGRSINVISLAGLAFAVGMVVDAAIVVLENIYRHREAGHSAKEAAYLGAKQVWGAVLVSALTTVMVFIPILVMKLEVGQLFRDIAVAISVSVLLSLVVSITVIPALSNRVFGGKRQADGSETFSRLPLPGIDQLARGFVFLVMGFIRGIVRSRLLSFAVVAAVTAAAVTGAERYLPKLEYLPEGNRNLVFGIIIPPPGYNLATTTGIAQDIETAIRPHWASVSGSESAPGEPPKIERFFFVARRSTTFLGAVSVDPQRAGELIPLLRKPVFREPGTFGFISQPSIFGRGIGGGRKIQLDISGQDLEQILGVAARAAGKVVQHLPMSQGHQFRPNPGARARRAGGTHHPEPPAARRQRRDRKGACRDRGRLQRRLAGRRGDRGQQTPRSSAPGPGEKRDRDPGHRRPAGGHFLGPDRVCGFARRRDYDLRPDRDPTPGAVPHRHSRNPSRHRRALGNGPRYPARPSHRAASGRGPTRGHQDRALRDRRQADPDLARHAVAVGAVGGDRLSGHGGLVRELRLPADHPALGATGRRRRRGRTGRAQHLPVPTAGYADPARFRDPDRHRGQQRDPAGASDPLPSARGRHDGGRGDPGGDAQPHPADFHVDPDQRGRDAAAGGLAGRRLGTLPRARFGGGRRARALGPADAAGRAADVGHAGRPDRRPQGAGARRAGPPRSTHTRAGARRRRVNQRG